MTQSELSQIAHRVRLAHELHDGIAQDLVGVGYGLDLLLANPDTNVEARSQLRTLRLTVTELIDKVRREIYFLRQPSMMDLSEEIKTTAQMLCAGLELVIDVDDVTPALDSEFSYEILRIAQEALRNIAAHAQASKVNVSLSRSEDALELHISDDGIGGADASPTGYGIEGIRDRAAAINASLEIQSDSQGTRVWLSAPIEKHANV